MPASRASIATALACLAAAAALSPDTPPLRAPDSQRCSPRRGALVNIAAVAFGFASPPRATAIGQDCIKRGLLGKCEELGVLGEETPELRIPGVDMEKLEAAEAKRREAYQAELAKESEADDANPLITRLRKKTVENAQRNALTVEMKTIENGQAGDFGPFQTFVPVRTKGGAGYVTLTQRQFEKLSDQKKIKNREFVDDKWIPEQLQLKPVPDGEGKILFGVF